MSPPAPPEVLTEALTEDLQQTLPPLRDDLGLFPGPPAEDGTPSWTIHDPVSNRYHRLSHQGLALLRHWPAGTPAEVLAAVHSHDGMELETGDIRWMIAFLDRHDLLRRDSQAGVASLKQRLEERQGSGPRAWLIWLLHHYLFLRIPLLRPDALLSALLPWVRPLYSRQAAAILLLATMAGVFLALRQWDSFLAATGSLTDGSAALWLPLALSLSKVCHELGHALTARRLGCRVPAMGVAFLVMVPVLYTDTSDAWRLADRRQRLAIGGAGIIAELGLASLALLAWSLLPDGPARAACLALVTVAAVTTVTINSNPLMRMDGYYLLSDWLGVENLQERAFRLGRWFLRELLFGLGEAPPEPFSPALRRRLILYAWGAWLYRLVLFSGIALLVYHTFFKLLGLALFAVEAGWFILRPLAREAGEWWKRRQSLRLNRNLLLTLGTLLVLLLLPALPLHRSIRMPGVARAAAYTTLYAPLPAQVEQVFLQQGQPVKTGEVLAVLASPDLEQQLAENDLRRIALRLQLQREAASPETREDAPVLRRQLATLEQQRQGLLARREQLTLRAPLDGEVVSVTPGLRPGLWVEPSLPLASVADRSRPEVSAFVSSEDLPRLPENAPAVLVADDPALPALPLRVVSIARLDTRLDTVTVENPALAGLSAAGAPDEGFQRQGMANQPGSKAGITTGPHPPDGQYRVILTPDGDWPALPPALPTVIHGVVVARGEAETPLRRLGETIAAVLVRESGF